MRRSALYLTARFVPREGMNSAIALSRDDQRVMQTS